MPNLNIFLWIIFIKICLGGYDIEEKGKLISSGARLSLTFIVISMIFFRFFFRHLAVARTPREILIKQNVFPIFQTALIKMKETFIALAQSLRDSSNDFIVIILILLFLNNNEFC